MVFEIALKGFCVGLQEKSTYVDSWIVKFVLSIIRNSVPGTIARSNALPRYVQ